MRGWKEGMEGGEGETWGLLEKEKDRDKRKPAGSVMGLGQGSKAMSIGGNQ